ncbi:cytochrome P450 [Lenzites betulinus]|nr:cytochrome P450 [Lenzites betulinus]
MFSQPWKQYAKWASELGPLITVKSYGCPIIVINTVDAALELLDKRSAHFSCKPRWPMAELLGRQNNIGFQYYNKRLRQARRVLHGALNPHAITNVWGRLLDAHSSKLLRRFLASPETFYADVQASTEELIVQFTYGKKPESEYVELAKSVLQQTGISLQPGRWLVNSFPILIYLPSWMPGAGFQRWAKAAREAFHRLTRIPFDQVKDDLAAGKANTCFVRLALEASGGTAEEDDIVMCAAGSLYSEPVDQLAGFILNFILLLTRNPYVQARARKEIASVVGPNRLPGLQDQSSLPYVDCVIQEVHRFNPTIPLVTHANSKEDEYLCQTIPEKTWLMANVWAMLHDEDEYPDPDVFRPERFIPRDGRAVPRDPRTLVFGFGRRICPGRHLAETFIYLVVARTMAALDLHSEVQDGVPLLPPLDFIIGLVPCVHCVITAWSTETNRL